MLSLLGTPSNEQLKGFLKNAKKQWYKLSEKGKIVKSQDPRPARILLAELLFTVDFVPC